MKNENFSFDSSFKELEKIVQELESGEASLEENLRLYEKGMKLCKSCKANLKNAKLEIEYLNNEFKKD